MHSYNNGTNITIDTNKNINSNSPLVGISGIQNTGDIVLQEILYKYADFKMEG